MKLWEYLVYLWTEVGLILIMLFLAFLLLFVLVVTKGVRAHGHCEDVGDFMDLRDPVSQSVCCDEEDCVEIGTPIMSSQGVHILQTGELIPWHRLLRSCDGKWYRCRDESNKTRCLIGPNSGV